MSKSFENINDSFLKENKYIFKKYKPIKKIGYGHFGNIYSVIRLKDKNIFAMKTENIKSNIKILESEAYYLFTLQGFGIPKLIYFGHTKKYNILIDTLLNKSLEDLYVKENIFSNIEDICLIGIQILDRLEWIHSKNIIYRDVKPENFLIGINDPNVIYVIDFGLCKKYRSSKTGKHILPRLTGKFNGNFKYASLNVLKGKESSRRDDLISLGYMLIYLLKKELPWDFTNGKLDTAKYYEIVYLKENDGFGKLFRNIPKEFVEFFKYAKSLKFEQEPSYSLLRSLLIKIISNKNSDFRKITFSWINLKNKELFGIPKSSSKRKMSPYVKILNNIKEEKSKRKNKLLSGSNLINDLKRFPLSRCKDLISNDKRNKNKSELERVPPNYINNTSQLNLSNLLKKKEIIVNIPSDRKYSNSNLIIKDYCHSPNNINKNKNVFIKKRINTISKLNYYNNIINSKENQKNRKKN